MKTLAISNHKGGVTKTTTAINLGACLAADGYKVLLIDLDPQASLSAALGIDDSEGQSMAEVIGGSSPGKLAIDKVIVKKGSLFVAPSDLSLANCELGLTQRLGRENVLKNILTKVNNKYDLAIIDCPPSLSILTVNALVACQAIIAPVLPQAADLRGLSLFIQSLDALEELNPEAKLLGVLVTQFDTRLTHHAQALEILEKSGLPLFKNIIGRTVKAAESAGVGQPLVEYEPNNPRSIEYKEFSNEVKQWLKKP